MPAVFALGMALLAKSAYQMQTLESNDPKNPQDPPLQGTLRPRSVGRMLPSFPKQSRRMSAAKALSSEFQGPKVLNGCTGFGFRFGFGGGGGGGHAEAPGLQSTAFSWFILGDPILGGPGDLVSRL